MCPPKANTPGPCLPGSTHFRFPTPGTIVRVFGSLYLPDTGWPALSPFTSSSMTSDY